MLRCKSSSVAGIRFIARLLTTSIVSVGVVFYTKWAFQHFHPTGFRVYILALLPAIANVASLVVVGLYISEEKDEFERSIIIRSVLWGLGAALAVSSVWGTLEQFAQAPHLTSFLSYLSFWIVMAISGAIIRLRYR